MQNNKDRNIVIANDKIRSKEVRCILPGGEPTVMNTQKALSIAYGMELDLILISPNANPPVAKVASLNKYIYDKKQKEKQQKKRQRENFKESKELRMTLNIEQHDLETKCRNARKFLDKDMIVTITIVLKGRERGKQDMARQLLAKFAELSNSTLGQVTSNNNRISAKLQ